MLRVFQEGEEGKEEEEKEFFGKLEYTLDYNFTDNQVHKHTHLNVIFCKTFQPEVLMSLTIEGLSDNKLCILYNLGANSTSNSKV